MKKFIVVLSLILFSGVLFAQDRVNSAKFNFFEKSQKITNITGWAYNNSAGQWTENPNVISTMSLNRLSSANKKYAIEHATNVKSVQLMKFKHNGEVKYVVELIYATGHYLYPAIMEDWISEVEHLYILLSKEEYDKFVNPSEQLVAFEAREASWWEGGISTEQESINRGIRDLVDNTSMYPLTKGLAFKRYKNVIRFDFETKQNYGKWDKLETEYFEVPVEIWKF